VIQQYANWDALINALLAGEIDLTDNAMPVQYFEVLDPEPLIRVVSRPPGYYYALAFNVSAKGTKHPAIDDPAVREAIDYAVDRQKLIEVALLGHGIQCPTDWACGPFVEALQDPSLEVTPYDVEIAKGILDKAGYLDGDGDGIRETAEGKPLEFRLFFDVNNPTQFSAAELISDGLAVIGINVEMEGLESGTLFTTVTGTRDFDMFILYMVGEVLPQNADFYFSCWSSEEGEGTFNYSGYCNEEMEGLIAQLFETIDPDDRLEVVHQISRKLNQERPLLMLAGEYTMQAYRSDRFSFREDYCPGTQGMWDWYSLLNAEVVK
jgi:peptide/nickel transport system substrate-binding protein